MVSDNDLVLKSIRLFPDQIQQSYSEVSLLDLPETHRALDNIVIGGMGGSLFSYFVINSFFASELVCPLLAQNDYKLAPYINEKSLFITSSYSGNTEEVLTLARQADSSQAKLLIITAGGELGALAQEKNWPIYQFSPKNNPSNQPRIGLGYMIFGALALLERLGYLESHQDDFATAISYLKEKQLELEQKARALSEKLKDRFVILIGAEHLSGAVHVCRNQINENAKCFASYNLIPELNHHLLEGLTNPTNMPISFLFYSSSFYDSKNNKRMELTEEVIGKQNREVNKTDLTSPNKLADLLIHLQFGSLLTYFLAIQYGVDPAQVPWVDYFKERLT